MSRSINFMLASALVSTGACSSDPSPQADRAAEDPVATSAQSRVATSRVAAGEAPDRAEVAETESAGAETFALHRATRVRALTAEHGVLATQAGLVESLASALPLTAIGRSELTAKLTVFAMRLADSAQAIDALRAIAAAEFAERDEAVAKAMTRLEDARTATWTALADAPRLDRSASL